MLEVRVLRLNQSKSHFDQLKSRPSGFSYWAWQSTQLDNPLPWREDILSSPLFALQEDYLILSQGVDMQSVLPVNPEKLISLLNEDNFLQAFVLYSGETVLTLENKIETPSSLPHYSEQYSWPERVSKYWFIESNLLESFLSLLLTIVHT